MDRWGTNFCSVAGAGYTVGINFGLAGAKKRNRSLLVGRYGWQVLSALRLHHNDGRGRSKGEKIGTTHHLTSASSMVGC